MYLLESYITDGKTVENKFYVRTLAEAKEFMVERVRTISKLFLYVTRGIVLSEKKIRACILNKDISELGVSKGQDCFSVTGNSFICRNCYEMRIAYD